MFYEKIQLLRVEHNITVENLCNTLEIPPKIYLGYENGSKSLTTIMAIKLAKYYGVNVDYLIGRTDIKEPYP